MDYNKFQLAGKVTEAPKVQAFGSIRGAKFTLCYTDYNKKETFFTVYVPNEKKAEFCLNYLTDKSEVFVEGSFSSRDGKPISLMAFDVKPTFWGKKPDRGEVTTSDFKDVIPPFDDDDDIPF